MRVKPLPEPPADPSAIEDARRAIPLVPEPEGDCCARIVDRLGVERDEAREWLTLLRGLGLVRRGESGFVRTDENVTPGGHSDTVDARELAAAFRENVFGAAEALDILEAATEPLDAATVFERFEPHVPDWERRKRPGAWRRSWRERTGRLLEWLALLGLAERADGGYVAASRE